MTKDYTNYSGVRTHEASSVDQGLRSYMLTIYNYMAAALALTGFVAFFTYKSGLFMTFASSPVLNLVVALAPLGFVIFMSVRINKMSFQAAQASFWAFASLMGLSLSYVFAVYTATSIAKVFFITASTFGAMSIYGYTTKKDLSGFGNFLIMGLIGIIIASLVNIFLKSSGLSFAISILGVLIFTGLTAYDTQRIKQVYFMHGGSGQTAGKLAIMGALNLYLDFINLFIMLLKLLGNRE